MDQIMFNSDNLIIGKVRIFNVYRFWLHILAYSIFIVLVFCRRSKFVFISLNRMQISELLIGRKNINLNEIYYQYFLMKDGNHNGNKVTVTRKWYMTLYYPKMHPHTKFGMPNSKNIRDMPGTQ